MFPLERQYDPEAASEQTDGMNKRSEEGRGEGGLGREQVLEYMYVNRGAVP